MNTTNEMRKIADGLGSGVSPDQIRSSIDLGTTWLQEIKDIGKLAIYDFLWDQSFFISKIFSFTMTSKHEYIISQILRMIEETLKTRSSHPGIWYPA